MRDLSVAVSAAAYLSSRTGLPKVSGMKPYLSRPTVRLLSSLALAPVVLLGACSSDAEVPASSSTPVSAPPAASSAASSPEPSEAASSAESPTPEQTPSAEPSKEPTSSKLTLSVAGKKQTLSPTDVYCQGKSGSIRRAVAKTNNRPPLVEVEGERFLLVKTGRGKPFKINSPKGVSIGKDSVSFDGVKLSGGATLDGAITCTAWEN